MKRYDSSRMIRVVLTPEQKQWLQSQATGMQSMSAILRSVVMQAMLLDQQGLLPPTGSIDDHR
jgi:hypothetical protein